MDFELL